MGWMVPVMGVMAWMVVLMDLMSVIGELTAHRGRDQECSHSLNHTYWWNEAYRNRLVSSVIKALLPSSFFIFGDTK